MNKVFISECEWADRRDAVIAMDLFSGGSLDGKIFNKAVRGLVELEMSLKYPNAPAEKWELINKDLEAEDLCHFGEPVAAYLWIMRKGFRDAVLLKKEMEELESNSLIKTPSLKKEKRKYKKMTGIDLDYNPPLPF